MSMRFRGREMAYMEKSKKLLDQCAEELSDIAVIEKPAKIEGRSISLVLAEKRS